MHWAFIFILLPVLATCAMIDEEIAKGAKGLQSLNVFRINSNYTVELVLDMDMLLPVDQFRMLFGAIDRSKKEAIPNEIILWPNGEIPYEISPEIGESAEIIREAISHWETYTCLTFTTPINKYYGIQFVASDSAMSYLGNRWTKQPIGISPNGLKASTVIHEIGHAVGIPHQHMRPDRNKYVKINVNAFANGMLVHFLKMKDTISTFSTAYDYLSIMHYSGLGMLTTLDPAYQNVIGRAITLSFKDIKLANYMYNCAILKGDCPEKDCPFNGFVFFKEFNGMPKCTCFCESDSASDPLVPCANIDKEKHTYKLSLTGQKSSNTAPLCFDVRTNCLDMRADGHCVTDPQTMITQCAKTCDTCGKGSNLCIDFSSGCYMMAGYCGDKDLKNLLEPVCPKSCKICPVPSTSCDVQAALSEIKRNDGALIYPTIAMVIMQTLIASLRL